MGPFTRRRRRPFTKYIIVVSTETRRAPARLSGLAHATASGRKALSGLRSKIVVNNAPRDKREVGAPVKAVEHVDDRQAMNGRLSVRAQFDGARSTPAFVHADVRQPTRSQLPDRWTAINVIDCLQINVEGEIEVPHQTFEAVRLLLRRHGSGQHVDPVAPDDADREIAANFEQGLAELLRLAVHLPAM